MIDKKKTKKERFFLKHFLHVSLMFNASFNCFESLRAAEIKPEKDEGNEDIDSGAR